VELKGYKLLSIDFRRIASELLNTTYDESTIHFIRFKNYIDAETTIKEIVDKKISGVEYDFKECFNIEVSGWMDINPPVETEKHLKAIYDYMEYIIKTEIDIVTVAMRYRHGSSGYTDIVRNFLSKMIKPLIYFINDELSKEMLILENDKISNIGLVQNIGNNYGNVNMSSSGDITSTNTTNINEIKEIHKLVTSLYDILEKSAIDKNDKENAMDDLEVIKEQVNDSKPKKARLQKAFEGFKGFLSKLPATTVLAGEFITNSQMLIDKVRIFIDTLI